MDQVFGEGVIRRRIGVFLEDGSDLHLLRLQSILFKLALELKLIDIIS